MSPASREDRRRALEKFMGRWSEAEAARFNEAIAEFSVVDPRDWLDDEALQGEPGKVGTDPQSGPGR